MNENTKSICGQTLAGKVAIVPGAAGAIGYGVCQVLLEQGCRVVASDLQGLHEYYRSRNLLKAAVTGRHVANAVLYFVTRQAPTTGATLPVDGGLPDATPR